MHFPLGQISPKCSRKHKKHLKFQRSFIVRYQMTTATEQGPTLLLFTTVFKIPIERFLYTKAGPVPHFVQRRVFTEIASKSIAIGSKNSRLCQQQEILKELNALQDSSNVSKFVDFLQQRRDHTHSIIFYKVFLFPALV